MTSNILTESHIVDAKVVPEKMVKATILSENILTATVCQSGESSALPYSGNLLVT